MKKIILTVILAVLSVSAFAQTGKSLYEKYSDLEGVEAVYISSAMFKLIGKLPVDMGTDSVDIGRLVRSLKGMYILNIPNSGDVIRPGNSVRLGRFSDDEWLVCFGWYSFGGNRPVCGWYLTNLQYGNIKPLQKTDLDDIYLVERG